MELRPVGDQGRKALTRRRILRVLVKLGLLVVAGAFVAVFLRGFFPPGTRSGDVIDVGGIPPGSARLEAWDGKPVWVVNRSREQLEALDALSDYVAMPAPADPPEVDNRGRSVEPAYGIYLAATDTPGVLVQFTRERPRALADGIPWRGGFVDPAGDAVFDLAGRRYRATTGPPLAAPPHRYLKPAMVRFGQW